MAWMPPEAPYTPKEVASMYGVSTETILREIRKGTLKARHKKGEVRRWYITREAIEEWAQSGMLE